MKGGVVRDRGDDDGNDREGGLMEGREWKVEVGGGRWIVGVLSGGRENLMCGRGEGDRGRRDRGRGGDGMYGCLFGARWKTAISDARDSMA